MTDENENADNEGQDGDAAAGPGHEAGDAGELEASAPPSEAAPEAETVEGPWPAELSAELVGIRARFPFPKAAMVPVLRRLQAERGWIDDEVRDWVADFLSVTAMEVHEVATFYPMLYTRPVGRHVIHVCRTLSCDVCGARELWQHLESKLGIGRGETTADGRYTLKAAECLASCGTAPVMLVNNVRHENLSHGEADEILEACK